MGNKARYISCDVLLANSFKELFFFFISDYLNDTFHLKYSENTDAETESAASDADHDDSPLIINDTASSSIPPNRELSFLELKERRARMSDSFEVLMHATFSATDDSSEADKTLTGKFSTIMNTNKDILSTSPY